MFSERLQSHSIKFDLNHAVEIALVEFNACYTPKASTRGFSPWPQEVLVRQDASADVYYRCLQSLCFDVNLFPESLNKAEVIDWQVRQVYRLLNAAVSSCHPQMINLKKHRDSSSVY